MCRSIKTLREPYTNDVTDEEITAAALQYVRKISGFRSPAAHNAEAFRTAVAAVAAATHELLDQLVVRPAPARAPRSAVPVERSSGTAETSSGPQNSTGVPPT